MALQLRLANTRFENRIGGAAEVALAEDATLTNEMVFVVPLSESAPPNVHDSHINQKLTETFGVIVALKMDTDLADKTGIIAFDKLHDVRTEIFGALLGWQMPEAESLCYYSGGRLIDYNAAWLWYQFEFSVDTRLQALVELDMTDVELFKKIYAQYVLGPWEDSEAYPLKGVEPLLTIDETDPDQSDLRLVDMKDMIQEDST